MGRTNTNRWSAIVLFITLAFVGVALSGCMQGDEEDQDRDQVTPEEDTQDTQDRQQEQGRLMLFLRDAGEQRGVTGQEQGQIGTQDDRQGTTGGQQTGQQDQQQDGLQGQQQGQQTQQDQQQDGLQGLGQQQGQQQQAEIDWIELNISQVTVQGGGQGQVGAESDLGDDTSQGANGQQNDSQSGQGASDQQNDSQFGQDAQNQQQTDTQVGQGNNDQQDANSQIGQETDPVTPETDDGFGQGTGSTRDTGGSQSANGQDLLDEQHQVTFGGGGDDEFVVQSEMASGTYDNITIQVSEIRTETEEGCALVFATDDLEINIEGSFQVDSDSTTQVLAEIDVTQALLSGRALSENCPQQQDGGFVDEVTPQEEQRVDDAQLQIETVQVLVATDVSLFHESTNTFDEDAAESQGETQTQGSGQNQTNRQNDRRTRDDQTVTP